VDKNDEAALHWNGHVDDMLTFTEKYLDVLV
jgi:hypothetical protein